MREGWGKKTIGEIASVKGGKRVPKGYKLLTEPTPYPYITVSDFREDGTVDKTNLKYIGKNVYEQIQRYTISSNDLYISIAGTIGKTGSVPEELDGANLTENACRLIFHDGVDRSFMYYFTKSNSFIEQAGKNTRIAAQPKLALKRLKTILLQVPPLPEQKRIVAILDEAFSGITQAVTNAERNLANARELFESYLNSIFAQKGEGWIEKKLNDFCYQITVGHVGSMASKYIAQGIPFLRSQNIQPFRIVLENVKYIDNDFHSSLQKSSLCPRDVVIVRTGYPGTTAVIPPSLPVANCSDLVIARPKEILNPYYLAIFMNSVYGKKKVSGNLVGTAQKHFNVSAAKNIDMTLPPIEKQGTIVSNVERFQKKTQRLETIYQQKLTALAELKQSILQKAFAGELTADTVYQQVVNG